MEYKLGDVCWQTIAVSLKLNFMLRHWTAFRGPSFAPENDMTVAANYALKILDS